MQLKIAVKSADAKNSERLSFWPNVMQIISQYRASNEFEHHVYFTWFILMSCYWKFKIDKIASFVLISEEVQNLVCSLRNKRKQQHIYVFVKHSIASLKT